MINSANCVQTHQLRGITLAIRPMKYKSFTLLVKPMPNIEKIRSVIDPDYVHDDHVAFLFASGTVWLNWRIGY